MTGEITPEWLSEVGGGLQLQRAENMLLRAPLPGLSRADVQRLIARHEPAILAQGARGFHRQHDPADAAPWKKLREHVQFTIEQVLSPDLEPASSALLLAFETALRVSLEPDEPNRAYLKKNVGSLLVEAQRLAPKIGGDIDWIWRLDLIELLRKMEHAHEADTPPALRRSKLSEAAQARRRWYERWTDILLTYKPDPTHTAELKYHMMGRLILHGWKPVRVAPIPRGEPQRADEPDLAPMLAWHWDQKDTAPVQPMALDLNTLMRGLTEDPTWRADRTLLGQILARVGIFLCDEVGRYYANPIAALAGKVVRRWHAASAPQRLRRRPSDETLEPLALELEKAGFTNQTVRAFQVGYPPFDGSADVRELLNVLRLELEVNLEGGYARDRVSVEFNTLDVLSALAAVEESAVGRRR